MHKTIKKVSEDIDRMKFNTAIAALMSLLNEITRAGSITRGELKTFITLLNPFAPHITEEMWSMAGFDKTVSLTRWPSYDPEKTMDDEIEIVLQVNGKVREKMMIGADWDNESIKAKALENEKIKEYISDGNC